MRFLELFLTMNPFVTQTDTFHTDGCAIFAGFYHLPDADSSVLVRYSGGRASGNICRSKQGAAEEQIRLILNVFVSIGNQGVL
jgi:hypothetical protein